jgi:hypothetical protein
MGAMRHLAIVDWLGKASLACCWTQCGMLCLVILLG